MSRAVLWPRRQDPWPAAYGECGAGLEIECGRRIARGAETNKTAPTGKATEGGSRKTLKAFKWATLAISFYHPAGAKPGSEEESCVCSFTGTNRCYKAAEFDIPNRSWSLDDAGTHWGCRA